MWMPLWQECSHSLIIVLSHFHQFIHQITLPDGIHFRRGLADINRNSKILISNIRIGLVKLRWLILSDYFLNPHHHHHYHYHHHLQHRVFLRFERLILPMYREIGGCGSLVLAVWQHSARRFPLPCRAWHSLCLCPNFPLELFCSKHHLADEGCSVFVVSMCEVLCV